MYFQRNTHQYTCRRALKRFDKNIEKTSGIFFFFSLNDTSQQFIERMYKNIKFKYKTSYFKKII